ncbi:hypothetical protein [Empedobacter sp. UBA7248]|uniref:hypothetical protein n=1 Tax=Empedobacter sp. UBA7248 TaxID=1946448 RepID=UPI0025B8A70C|nr:hypothetical protein [Empedobacter sp. UBA7248]
MKKNYLLATTLLLTSLTNAQVGVGTTIPNSTLDVRGSLQTAFKEISSSVTLGINDYYTTYNGTNDATITLPVIGTGTSSFNGRIYRIKNATTKRVTVKASGSNTIRATSVPVASFIIEAGCYVEVVNNTNTVATSATWDLSYIAQPYTPNVSIYGTTLKIPHFSANISNHNSTDYDSGTGTEAWWVISSTATSQALNANTSIKPSKMTIVYEYQGTAFDIVNLHPILTAGNTTSFPDVFTVSFGGFTEVNGKTRLTLTVARIDLIGTETSSSSNWQGTGFFINALFTKKLF